MADMSRCCICTHFSFELCTCDIYPNKIPEKIFIEETECNYYTEENSVADNNLDFPIAKGR